MIKFLFAVVIIMITSIVCLVCCRVIDEFIDRKIEKDMLGLPEDRYYNYFYKGDDVILWIRYKKGKIKKRKMRIKGNNVVEEIVMLDGKKGRRIESAVVNKKGKLFAIVRDGEENI